VYDKIVIEDQKKRKYRNIFLHKTSSERWFGNGIHSLVRRADATLPSFTVYDAYRYFVGQL